MKILHTADWHIGNFPGPEKDGKNLRAQDTGMCINHLNDIARLEKPDIIVVSGDIFHQARVWADRGLSEVKTAIRAIEALSETAQIVVLRGTPNHDGEEQFNLLAEHFENNNRVYIVIKPTIVNLHLNDDDTLQVACLPGFDRGEYRAKFPGLSREDENLVFTEELAKTVLALRANCKDEFPAILLAHYTVPGCNTESGQTPFLAQFEPVITPETLDAAGFDLVCLGHIHRPQAVESCQNTYYSGAINAMNFNDEGQKRGFWIHELSTNRRVAGDRSVAGAFYKTPSREFKTIRLDNDSISMYNVMGFAGIVSDEITNCEDKIVRVIYSCTEEENKAFNRAALEHDLYENAGVFWVSEITPDNITVGTNKNELSEKSDPEANLVEYLREKALDEAEISQIVELARPIIAEVMANNTASRLTGMFVPLEISVKNYRNYVEETFSFKDVTFCTINGKNGAGKSSLFMDAILDALYEEPREGDLTAWIRADEKARSGSISFTFAIGEKIFRVVRTRAKSGKATLNLAELVDGEWENRSKEKYRDTQEEIVNVLGMDSLTFRSCALIMQDQYGLFLQADKEARMSILGNILGLGIYGEMETIARNRLSEYNRVITLAKNDIVGLQRRVGSLGNPRENIANKEQAIASQEDNKKLLTKERDNINILLNSQLEQAKKAESLSDSINTLKTKETAIHGKIAEQKNIIERAMFFLDDEMQIHAKVARLRALEERANQLATKKAVFDKTIESRNKAEADRLAAENTISAERRKADDIDAQIRSLKQTESKRRMCRFAAEQYSTKTDKLLEMEKRSEDYNRISKELQAKEAELAEMMVYFRQESATKDATLKEYERKSEILSSCNCVDIDNAQCEFLADAKEAANVIESYRAQYSKWKEIWQSKIDTIKGEIKEITARINSVGYDPAAFSSLRNEIFLLESEKNLYESVGAITAQIEQLQIRKADSDKILNDAQTRLESATAQLEQTQSELASYDNFEAEYKDINNQIVVLKPCVADEAQLPVYKERKNIAERRIAELNDELGNVINEMSALETERRSIIAAMGDMDGLKAKLNGIDRKIAETQENIDSMRIFIGSLQKVIEDIEDYEKQIKELQSRINADSAYAARYEILKNAFSQDGVPHNIIRTIVPILTATSNTILGQMTGGKMGMQFVTDKVLKSNKKEVVTLDIVIEEYGKDTLPYLSKSGGEKVKSSLSAILSLAEIKSSQAGIQLGMLFIDEPPFLDDEGTQAYCDALETIQRRYSDLKIMAITHDPTFKARFPQNLDVVKTESGSKVIFE